jgi:3-oxoacyl-[acyl-carrier-protein] synthase III
MIHRLTDPNDPGCFLWSDGAGAAVLEGGNLQGFVGAGIPGRRRLCIRLGHCSRRHLRAGEHGRREGRAYADASRKGIYPASTKTVGRVHLFKRIALFTANDVMCTQISKPSIAIAAERRGVPVEKCHTIMEKYSYTGSACIPMALDDAIELGKLKRGDLVVMISLQLGYSQAAAAVRMTV